MAYSYYPQYYPQNNNALVWVQGLGAAKSYSVAPNTTIALWDSDEQKIYLKSADASGMPSIKTLEYTIVEGQAKTEEFARKEDLDKLKERLDHLYDELEGGK